MLCKVCWLGFCLHSIRWPVAPVSLLADLRLVSSDFPEEFSRFSRSFPVEAAVVLRARDVRCNVRSGGLMLSSLLVYLFTCSLVNLDLCLARMKRFLV